MEFEEQGMKADFKEFHISFLNTFSELIKKQNEK